MDIRETILNCLKQTAEETQSDISSSISDETILLECGLSSLGFAILVAKLEQTLGYDPFVLMEEAVYPTTFSEFVSLYEKFKDRAAT